MNTYWHKFPFLVFHVQDDSWHIEIEGELENYLTLSDPIIAKLRENACAESGLVGADLKRVSTPHLKELTLNLRQHGIFVLRVGWFGWFGNVPTCGPGYILRAGVLYKRLGHLERAVATGDTSWMDV